MDKRYEENLLAQEEELKSQKKRKWSFKRKNSDEFTSPKQIAEPIKDPSVIEIENTTPAGQPWRKFYDGLFTSCFNEDVQIGNYRA